MPYKYEFRQQCWTYRGRATAFHGNFGAYQPITTSLVMEFENDAGNHITTATENSSWVYGPDGFYIARKDNAVVVTHKPGRYEFRVDSEHGISSAFPLFFQICAGAAMPNQE